MLSINDRPVSAQITQCLVSDKRIPFVAVVQGDVMLTVKPTVLRNSVVFTAIRCLQKDPDFLRANKDSHSP